jgi:membrane-associated phospholipid phosphatase
MTMSEQPVHAATNRDPYGGRATTVRVLANALLVLLAFEVVSFVVAAAGLVAGTSGPMTPAELVPILAVFLLIRWVAVLPGMLPVLAGIDYLARRVPYARALTAIIAFTPMIAWELTKSPGSFPSDQGAILGVTAVVFAALARLPVRRTAGRGTPPPAESVIASH